ncbi:hypothetical protein O0235_10720 [Tepidiforma flava]|uniref:4Fe-4S ferredoxin-type domain-containing protein n=1 Tax=Tepidiforma flava TaxID=3004094 RepID=A0ABY7M3Y0_9CHLR|nr:4Fe-4S double cluster binding domain-containing protein [Tepidiforma flava]WBL35258.1 hypothetical protein O0235_10720 [Tepidiforma flava]
MLGVIATTLELDPDPPLKKTCERLPAVHRRLPDRGDCGGRGPVVDARRCISYLTIELRGPVPRDLRAAMGMRVFGCDDCLDACPVGAGRWRGRPGTGGCGR